MDKIEKQSVVPSQSILRPGYNDEMARTDIGHGVNKLKQLVGQPVSEITRSIRYFNNHRNSAALAIELLTPSFEMSAARIKNRLAFRAIVGWKTAIKSGVPLIYQARVALDYATMSADGQEPNLGLYKFALDGIKQRSIRDAIGLSIASMPSRENDFNDDILHRAMKVYQSSMRNGDERAEAMREAIKSVARDEVDLEVALETLDGNYFGRGA
ncbi:hypothetical protein HGB24_03635 [Candidatus Saccharibacteria bacterium]|nr:hypothetical protein [Candidatus Saccharibacteria bacterium]